MQVIETGKPKTLISSMAFVPGKVYKVVSSQYLDLGEMHPGDYVIAVKYPLTHGEYKVLNLRTNMIFTASDGLILYEEVPQGTELKIIV